MSSPIPVRPLGQPITGAPLRASLSEPEPGLELLDVTIRLRRIAKDRGERIDTLVAALERAERKLSAYVGVCKDDKELVNTVLPMVRAALVVPPAVRP